MAAKITGSLRSHFQDAEPGAGARDRGPRAGGGPASTILILGRERDGQGPARPRHPRRLAARGREPVRPRGRGQPLRRALRERALRPRARRVHRRGLRQEGPARGRRGRAPSISTRSPRCRRRRRRSSCASSRRRISGGSAGVTTHPFRARLIVSVAARPRGARRAGRLPRRLLLSDRRRLGPAAAAERAARGHPAARARVREARRPRLRPARRAGSRRTPRRRSLRHPWPGNVRELLHVVEKAVLGADGAEVGPQDLPAGALGSPGVAARRRGREALDPAAAHRRVHRRDAAPRRRQPVARGQAARRLPKFLWERGKKVGG